MKKIKKLLPVLLMSIMSVSAFAEEALIDGIKYSLNDETSEADVISNYDNKYSGDITIPESVDYNDKTYSVTSIGESAFDCCTGLTSVTIPNSVTSIGKYAFYGCTGLTSVTIPNSVTSIGEYAFYDCSALESIIVEEGNTIYDSRENCNAIIETETNTLLRGCNNTVIPGSVTSIVEFALYDCKGLTSLTIPNSVTSIGRHAFYGCTGLTSLAIPNSVTSIGECAFDRCTGLESIIVEDGNTVYDSRNNCNAIIETETNTLLRGCNNTVIPGSVTSIDWLAFRDCVDLTSLTIPNSVTSIGVCAFEGCTGLTSVISLIEEPFEISENVFENWVEDHNEFTTATLYVPAGTKAKYESTPAWNKFKMIVEQEVNAVESAETDVTAEETERYNVSGQRISSPQKGISIVKMSDGTTRKVMCK